MSIEGDYFLDRVRLKQSLHRWKMVAIIALIIVVLVSVYQPGKQGQSSKSAIFSADYIARIKLSGIILENRERDDMLREIADNDNIKAVIMHVNSPGGTMTGGEALYDALKAVAEKKPLISVMGGVAASGGYMASLPAQRIVARNSTITGSIGVILETPEVSKLIERLGVEFHQIKSGELKGSPSPFQKMTPKSRQALQSIIDDSFDLFVTMVSDHRPLSYDEAKQLADGRVYTGRQALAHKLVDQIGDERAAIDWLVEQKHVKKNIPVKDQDIYPPKQKFQKFFQSTFHNITSWFYPSNDGIMTLY